MYIYMRAHIYAKVGTKRKKCSECSPLCENLMGLKLREWKGPALYLHKACRPGNTVALLIFPLEEVGRSPKNVAGIQRGMSFTLKGTKRYYCIE